MISLKKMFYLSLILFPIGTLIASVPIIGTTINKVLMFFIILGLIGFLDKLSYKTLILVFGVVALLILDLIFTDFPLINANEIFYLLIWVFFLNIYFDKERIWFNDLSQMNKKIKHIVIIWNILVVISLFLKQSFDQTGAFISFTGGMHRLDSSALLIISFILFLFKNNKNNKKVLILGIIPYIAIILSGARTYICIAFVIFILVLYKMVNKKIYFWLTVIPISILGISFIMNTSIMKNRLNFSNYVIEKYGYLGALTSGRTVFWQIDLKEFLNSSTLHKIFGNGFNFIRETNEKYYGDAIWAHNDFINILGCNGFFGLILYFISYFRVLNIRKKFQNKSNTLVFILINFIMFFNAMFNMLYTYQCAVFSIPFLMYYFYFESNKEELVRE